MRKRERENPCGICGHYHKYEEGEICGVCGHRAPLLGEAITQVQPSSAFPSEILKDFLYLGSYDNASRSELLRTQGISRILNTLWMNESTLLKYTIVEEDATSFEITYPTRPTNTVQACQTLHKISFTYYCLEDSSVLQFDDAVQILEQCSRDKERILVHCMFGKNRSAAIVIAYLMKCKGWRLAQSFQWVKDRRPIIDLSSAVYQQLVEYEKTILGSNNTIQNPSFPSSDSKSPFGFGFPSPADDSHSVFSQQQTFPIFGGAEPNNPPHEFAFGSTNKQQPEMMDNDTYETAPSSGTETPMDSY